MEGSEWMYTRIGEPSSAQGLEEEFLRATILERMRYTRWLAVSGGILVLLGSLLIAVGISQLTIGFNFTVVAPTRDWALGIAVGVAFVGLGAMLGFFAVSVKGPSLAWAEADRLSAIEDKARAEGLARITEQRPCPKCGNAYYVMDLRCPYCGYRVSEAESPKT